MGNFASHCLVYQVDKAGRSGRSKWYTHTYLIGYWQRRVFSECCR
jgi:hypothetical protein